MKRERETRTLEEQTAGDANWHHQDVMICGAQWQDQNMASERSVTIGEAWATRLPTPAKFAAVALSREALGLIAVVFLAHIACRFESVVMRRAGASASPPPSLEELAGTQSGVVVIALFVIAVAA